MAKFALIIGSILHDGGAPVVISGPEIPYAEQREKFKKFMSERLHEAFARVDFVDSRRGTTKHKTFITPLESERRAGELERQKQQFSHAGVVNPDEREDEINAEVKAEAQAKADAEAQAKADADAQAKADADAQAKAKSDRRKS